MTLGQQPGSTRWRYDAFLSYSHHDRLPVQGLHKALERIARPLGKRQALRVFRDDTDLTASPDLWAGVVQAMDQARYLVLVMSPRSSGSAWVNRELEHWLKTRGPGTLLLVLAQGRVCWHPSRQAFVPEYSDAAPVALTRPGALPREPAYLDVSRYGPWDPRSPAFRAQVTGLAAAIREVSRRDLENDDLREARRRAWVRRAVTGALAVLTVLSLVLSWKANSAEQEATTARVTSDIRRIAATAESLRGSNNALAIGLAREAVAMRTPALPEALEALANAKAAFAEDPLQPLGAPIPAHAGAVLDVALAPDGKTFVTGGDDGAVRLWSLDDRAQSGSDLRSPSDLTIYSVAVSERLIAASGDGEVLLWDATSRAPLTSVAAGSWVEALCFDPKGDRLAWAEPGRVVVRDVGRGTTVRTFATDKDINDLAFSQGGRLLAAGDAGGTVTVWDMTSGKRVFTVSLGTEGGVGAVAFRPDGANILAATTMDRKIHLYNADEKYAASTLTGHNDTVLSLAYTGDSYLISGSADGSIGLWDTDLHEQVGQPRSLGRGVVNAVAFSERSHALVSVQRDGSLSMWSYHPVPWQSARIDTLDAVPEGTQWLTGGGTTVTVRDGREKLRDIRTEGKVQVARFLPGGSRLITAGKGHAPQIWDAGTGAPIADLPYPRTLLDEEVDDAAVDPQGVRVAFADGDSTARVWTLADRSLAAAYTDKDSIFTVALDGAGRLAYGGKAKSLVVRELAGGTELWRKDLGDWVVDIEFSPDGHYVLAATKDGTATLFDAGSGAEVRRFPGQRDRVLAAAFSPDGRTLALAARYDGVRVWDVETGTELARLLQQPADPGPFTAALPDVETIRFSRDGRDLLAGDVYDLRIWPDLLDSGTGCEIAVEHVNRAQLEHYLPADHQLSCPYTR